MIDDVSQIIRRVGTVQVLDRFRRLADGDIEEKSPGDLVTIADRECELALIPELRAIRDVPVIGEESVAADPTLLNGLADLDACWIVDPVDGTANFAGGRTDFAVMVAYVEDHRTVAAWIWHPPTDDMVTAQRGGGAWRDDHRIITPPNPTTRRAVLKTYYVPEEFRDAVETIERELEPGLNKRCAGVEYVDLAEGRSDIYFFWRTFPWDHAPGTLIAEEAGMRVGRLDGSEYDPTDDRTGLLTAPPALWSEIAEQIHTATSS